VCCALVVWHQYDIVGLGGRDLEQCEGIDSSRSTLRGLIASENAAGVPASRIVLAGFSQGGALSLYTGLQHPEALAGILCMSGYLPCPNAIVPAPVSLHTPVQLLHGDSDPMVLPQWATGTKKAVAALGFKARGVALCLICSVDYLTLKFSARCCCHQVELTMYDDLPHSASAEELRDATKWLISRIPDVPVADAKPRASL
jgi:lysophospholipase-2